jgi:hypothetical protein
MTPLSPPAIKGAQLLPKAVERLLATEEYPVVRQGETATLVTYGAIAKLDLVQKGKRLGVRSDHQDFSIVILEVDHFLVASSSFPY